MVGKLNLEGIEFRFRQLFLSTDTLVDVSFPAVTALFTRRTEGRPIREQNRVPSFGVKNKRGAFQKDGDVSAGWYFMAREVIRHTSIKWRLIVE